MENNNLDLREDDFEPIEDQETTYAEGLSEAVENEIVEADATPEAADEVIGESEEASTETTEEASTETTEEQSEEIPEELSEEARRGRRRAFLSGLYDYAEIFAASIIAVIVIFSFCFRLCQVDGHSMQNTLDHNERIIAYDLFYTPKQGDIIVFHLVNDTFHRPLVKRVIATEGQTVEINYTDKKIYVDGVLYEDKDAYIEGGSYLIKFDFDTSYMSHEDGKLYYRATVPEGKVFVLGDNRNNSTDSRSVYVSFVDEDCILGKAILRLDPFTVFE